MPFHTDDAPERDRARTPQGPLRGVGRGGGPSAEPAPPLLHSSVVDALAESEAFVLAILNSVAAEIVVLDRDGVILAVNDAWRRFAAENAAGPGILPHGTDVGANYLSVCDAGTRLVPADGAQDASDGVRAVLNGTLPIFAMEYPCHSTDRQRWFSMTATPLGGPRRGAVVSHADITARRLAEEALQQAQAELEQRVVERTEELRRLNEHLRSEMEERLRAESALRESNELFSMYVRHSPVYTYIKTVTPTESRVVQASDNFRDMVGVSGTDMIGKTMAELFPAEFAAAMTATDWAVVANDEVVKLDEDYGDRHYTTIKFPIRLGDRMLLAGYTIDITEARRNESERRELEALNQQLLKSESLGRMAAAIAHHFNNQLQVVTMNLELAIGNLPPQDEAVERLSAAMHSARLAAETGTLLLTYLGQSSDRREPLDLSAACLQGLQVLRSVVPSAVALEHDIPLPGPTILAGPAQIQQALNNLVTNAWEACGSNPGRVWLSVTVVAGKDIPVAGRFPLDWRPQPVDYACLLVSDTGGGIDDGAIDKIFDPFYSSKFTGRGLGLSVVLGVARAHGGAVSVESARGQGSVFRMFLPVSAEAVAEATHGVPPANRAARGTTVLVVDDEPSVLNVAVLALTRRGFTVCAARDGVEALDVFGQHAGNIDCVLCDLSMPRMNGWQTLTALRRLAPGLPVILSSGYNEADAVEGGLTERPDAFLRKPYPMSALLALVRQVMERKPGEA